MNYVEFLVQKNKDKNENELLSWYLETVEMKHNNMGDWLLADSIQTAILWILKIKPKTFTARFTRLRRRLTDE